MRPDRAEPITAQIHERASRTGGRARYFLRAAAACVAYCVVTASLYAYYGDVMQAAVYVGGSVVSGIYWKQAARLTYDKLIRWGYGAVFVFILAIAFVLPPGPVMFAVYAPITLILGSLSKRPRVAQIAVASLVLLGSVTQILAYLAELQGWQGVDAPAYMVVTVTAVFSGVCGYTNVRLSAIHNDSKLEKLIASEKRLAREEASLIAQRERLEHATATLKERTTRLAQQAQREEAINDELRERAGDQERMVQAIHQDLREPLRGIVSFTQLIRRRLGTAGQAGKVSDYIAFAEDGGRRMDQMLADLLRYTRHEVEAAETIDLNELLDQVRDDLADALQRHDATLVLQPLPQIVGYPTQVRQLFQNLIANAVKFSALGRPPHIVVDVGDASSPTKSTIRVTDNGIGIPAARLEEVFGLFNRAHDKDTYEGSGVGLALCRRIAIAHGAQLAATSTEGEGTVFTISDLTTAPAQPTTQTRQEARELSTATS